jgi:hypothetical protein
MCEVIKAHSVLTTMNFIILNREVSESRFLEPFLAFFFAWLISNLHLRLLSFH